MMPDEKANSTEKPTAKPDPNMQGGISVRFPSPPTSTKPKPKPTPEQER
jgi:hypothetical protein